MAQGRATCEELLRELSAYLDGTLPAEHAARLTRHLESCTACRARYEDERAMVERLRQVRRGPAPPALRRRIVEDLQEQDRRGEGGDTPEG